MRCFAFAFIAALALASPAHAKDWRIRPGPEAPGLLAAALAHAQPGDSIRFARGFFALDAGFTLTTDGVDLLGEGQDKTILSFAGQQGAGDGVTIAARGLVVRDLAIEDARGAALKIAGADSVAVRGVRAQWAQSAPAASGVAIETSSNVLVQETIARGAGAGVAVLGARTVVVRDSVLENNIVGLRVSNSVAVEAFGNVAQRNATAVAVFDEAGKQQAGDGVLLTRNKFLSSDGANYAPAGSPLAAAPAGVGVFVSAARAVHVVENDIGENPTANVVLMAWPQPAAAANFNALPRNVAVRKNRFGRTGFAPAPAFARLQSVVAPDVIWDGATAYFAGGAPHQEPVLLAVEDNKSDQKGGPRGYVLGLMSAGGDFAEAEPAAAYPPVTTVGELAPVKLPKTVR
ncbi:MAG: parallel beta-helix domain-containing protein [Hyphomonadaceae bacterium]